MRVLFWTDSFHPYLGGIETFAAHLAPSLARRGHEMLLVTSHHDRPLPDRDEFDGVPVRRLPMHHALVRRDLALLVRTRRALIEVKRAFAADLYHVNLWGPTVTFHLATPRAHPAPTLLTVHGSPFPRPRGPQPAVARVLASADWLAAPSHAVLGEYLPQAPGLEARATVVPNGLPDSSLPPARLPDPPCGRFVEEKGLDLALVAFSRVAAALPHARLIVAGDGATRPVHQAYARSLGLGGRVEFTGRVPPEAVPQLMNRATCLVVPSRSEGFGFVVLEAALQGRPAVATQIEGLPEVVVDGQTGLLVPPEDPAALEKAMVALLTEPDRARRLGEAARHRARSLFTLERMVDAYELVYRQTAAITSPRAAAAAWPSMDPGCSG